MKTLATIRFLDALQKTGNKQCFELVGERKNGVTGGELRYAAGGEREAGSGKWAQRAGSGGSSGNPGGAALHPATFLRSGDY
jgi:hypothetical protein